MRPMSNSLPPRVSQKEITPDSDALCCDSQCRTSCHQHPHLSPQMQRTAFQIRSNRPPPHRNDNPKNLSGEPPPPKFRGKLKNMATTE